MGFLSKLFGKKEKDPRLNFDSSALNENDKVITFNSSVFNDGIAYADNVFMVGKWLCKTGDYVYRKESIGFIGATKTGRDITDFSPPMAGIIEILSDAGEPIIDNQAIAIIRESDQEPRFRKKSDIQTEDERIITYVVLGGYLKEYSIEKDGFTKEVIITSNDCIVLRQNDTDVSLKLFFRKKNEQQYFVLKFYSKYFSISEDDKLSLLFDSGDVVDVIFTKKSERVGKDSDGVIHQITQAIDASILNKLSEQNLSQWRLETFKNGIIDGKIRDTKYIPKQAILQGIDLNVKLFIQVCKESSTD